jgi:hypothetical protein
MHWVFHGFLYGTMHIPYKITFCCEICSLKAQQRLQPLIQWKHAGLQLSSEKSC